MPAAILVKGALIVVPIVITTAVVISQTPFGQDVRRKLAHFAYTLGDELNPNRRNPQQPRFNRPEDAEGFMEPHAGDMDADEESRRIQREELMYWNAIKLQNLEKQKAKEPQSPTFDDILRKHSAEEEEAYKTGAEIQSEGLLRRRGEGSRGMDRASLYSNPFADENNLDSDGDAKMIAPEEDEIEDIYTDNDLRENKKPATRVLAAASDYPVGENYTMQLQNFSGEANEESSIVEDHPSDEAGNSFMQNYMLGLEQENRERLITANLTYPEIQSESAASFKSDPIIEQRPAVQTIIDTPSQPATFSYPAIAHGHQTMPATVIGEPIHGQDNRVLHDDLREPYHKAQDYQMQLMLLEQQNKKRLMMARQEYQNQPQSLDSQKKHDREMQLHLLEQQNKKRFMMARQEYQNQPQSLDNQNKVSPVQGYEMQLHLLEQQNKKRLIMARQEYQNQQQGMDNQKKAPSGDDSTNNLITMKPGDNAALQTYNMQLKHLEEHTRLREAQEEANKWFNQKRAMSDDESTAVPPTYTCTALQDYHSQLLLLEQHNEKRRMIGQNAYDESVPNTGNSAIVQKDDKELVDVSEPLKSSIPQTPADNSMAFSGSASYHTPGAQSHASNDAFASIHAWSNSNAGFYSPLPGTPPGPASVAPSEPERLSGAEASPTDNLSVAGSGVDVDNDNASSVDGGRYDDVMSMDDGISTPGTWTEVGSVVSDDDSNHP